MCVGGSRAHGWETKQSSPVLELGKPDLGGLTEPDRNSFFSNQITGGTTLIGSNQTEVLGSKLHVRAQERGVHRKSTEGGDKNRISL